MLHRYENLLVTGEVTILYTIKNVVTLLELLLVLSLVCLELKKA